MSKDRRVALGKKIKKHRKLANLTQSDLSILVGHSSAAYIGFIESGDRNVNAIDLAMIARKLNVSTDELLKS